MINEKVEAFAEKVKDEIENAKHLSKEQKELLGLEIDEALECTSIDLASVLVTMTALRRVRFELRNADNIDISINKAVDKLKLELPGILQHVLTIHTTNCPLNKFDPEEFYKNVMVDVDKKIGSVLKAEPKQARTMKDLFYKFSNKAVDSYTPYIIMGVVILVYKYGFAALLTPIAKFFGFGG